MLFSINIHQTLLQIDLFKQMTTLSFPIFWNFDIFQKLWCNDLDPVNLLDTEKCFCRTLQTDNHHYGNIVGLICDHCGTIW